MGRKIFSCDFDGCNRAFSRPDDYARHRRATHGSQRGRYICGEDATHAGFGCGRRFNRRDVLQQHRRTTKAQTICVHRRYTPDSSSSPCMEENEHTEPAPDEENPEPFLYQLDPAILDSSRSNPLLLTEEDRSNIVDIWARCSSPSSESHPTMTTTPSTPLDSGSIPSRLRPGQVVGGYYELGNIIATSNYITGYWARDMSTNEHYCILSLPKSRMFVFGGARKALTECSSGPSANVFTETFDTKDQTCVVLFGPWSGREIPPIETIQLLVIVVNAQYELRLWSLETQKYVKTSLATLLEMAEQLG